MHVAPPPGAPGYTPVHTGHDDVGMGAEAGLGYPEAMEAYEHRFDAEPALAYGEGGFSAGGGQDTDDFSFEDLPALGAALSDLPTTQAERDSAWANITNLGMESAAGAWNAPQDTRSVTYMPDDNAHRTVYVPDDEEVFPHV